MRKILKIIKVEMKLDASGKYYWRTLALVEGGDVVSGYGKDWQVGEKVTAFFDDRYQVAKMQKTIDNDNNK